MCVASFSVVIAKVKSVCVCLNFRRQVFRFFQFDYISFLVPTVVMIPVVSFITLQLIKEDPTMVYPTLVLHIPILSSCSSSGTLIFLYRGCHNFSQLVLSEDSNLRVSFRYVDTCM